ncbi:MAG: TetR/AcrR family transcriptional regulator [Acidimicrobiales bacterium]
MNRPMRHKPESILAAALSVFFDEGVNVSTARIATAAGVSNGTLFNYFPTKQALIDALYVSIKSDLADAAGKLDDTDSIEQRMRQIWDRWFTWAREHRQAHFVVNLLHQAGLASHEAQLAGTAALAGPVRVLDDAMQSGLLVDLPLDYLGPLIQHHLDQAIASELDDRQSEIAFHVLWNGITQKTTAARNSTK